MACKPQNVRIDTLLFPSLFRPFDFPQIGGMEEASPVRTAVSLRPRSSSHAIMLGARNCIVLTRASVAAARMQIDAAEAAIEQTRILLAEQGSGDLHRPRAKDYQNE